MSATNPVVSAEKLQQNLWSADWRVVDCRFDLLHPEAGYSEWRNAHIPGAVYAHLDNDLSAPRSAGSGRHPLPDPHRLAKWFGERGISNDSHVVVYDAAGGAIAARCWWLLHWLGHRKVHLLDGGFSNWCREGRPVSAEPVPVTAAHFVAQVDMAKVLRTDEVTAWLAADGQGILLDARDARRFRGEAEPIDTVAGHIPGARNLPCSDNLSTEGLWLEPDAVQRNLEAFLGPPPGRDWAVMCGSGVTACHLALAGERAGYIMPRLYAGSWSEWIRDPGRPVARGGEAGLAGPQAAEPAST